ncbi:PAS domain S-box-containing protein [Luteibacter sp. UNC138MFCol5.1]|uniref:PAS domain S-box protein n=1 Tax=Luteibacter sp. UNC138MFCol5.1 TaxID=1502774 RepID=UPI0008BAF674|nr:PAS domain S-box protein [Luteibacter sp. UNC138MFCol5.1]SEO31878.1 PAS domain S-box-containing protein [Luteibacter sp. UNC138MFCol5.1]
MTAPAPVFDTELYQALFRTAPDAMVVVDRNGTIVLANPQADVLFGYAANTLRGHPIEDLLPGAVRDVHVAHRTAYMRNPRVRPMGAGYELTGVRADGTAFPVEIGLSPVSGGATPLFAASIRDISETQRARQALARARYDGGLAEISRRILLAANVEAAMEGIPALVAQALSVSVVALLLPDPTRAGFRVPAATGVDLDALENFARRIDVATLAALLPPALGPDPTARLPFPDPSDEAGKRSAIRDGVWAALPDREAPAGYIVVGVPADESFDWDRKHFLGSVANILAATIQRSRSEEQLAHAQRLDALGQLTGGIAHDFNNLLTIVSGNLQLLESDMPVDPEVQETIASASRAVERGSVLTRKLLAFSRRQRLNPQPVRCELLLADLNDMLGRTLGERIALVAECPEGLPSVYADPGELEAAIVNLALNARDAMPRGGKLTISARTHDERHGGGDLAPGRYVVFSVVDTGEGMPPEVLARALEPFYTTKGPNHGNGLGLSMVYGFATQSRGRLAIHSQAGAGTRVELFLPGAVDAADATAPPCDIQQGTETVLVVEDEAGVRRIAVAFLRGLGYEVVEAASATAARAALEIHPGIDVLFTDVALGEGESGFELAAELRERHPALRVLFTSGYEHGSSEDDANAPLPGMLLRKPYRREQLAAALRRVLDGDP